MKHCKPFRIVYLVILSCSVLGALLLVSSHPKFETDILSLLPSIHRDPVVEQALKVQASSLGKKVIVIVKSSRDTIAEREAERLAHDMRASGLFSRVDARLAVADMRPLVDLFMKHPFQLAPPPRQNSAAALVSAAQERAFAPDGIQWLQTADQDPLLLFPTYLQSLLPTGGTFSVRNGFLHVDDEQHRNVLITATLQGGAYSQDTQQAAVAFLNNLTVSPPSTILTSGIVLFAAESATRTKAEVSLISTLTMVAVVGFLIFAFRSFSAVVLVAGSVVTSFLGALFLSHSLWSVTHGQGLHLITIGFGSCLLGVCVDYAIHYMVAHRTAHNLEIQTPLEKIRAGLTLGFLTTVIGFLGIAISPFPGLQQLALFCILGLTLAFTSVYILFPSLVGQRKRDDQLLTQAERSQGIFSQQTVRIVLVALLAITISGLDNVAIIDDIRVLHTPSNHLIERQREVAKLVGLQDSGTVIVIDGATEEEVLQHEEAIRERLDILRNRDQLDSYRAVSTVIPSRQQQDKRFALFSSLVTSSPQTFETLISTLHLPSSAHAALMELPHTTPPSPATVQECLTQGACRSVEDLWLVMDNGRIVSTMPLNGFKGTHRDLIDDMPFARVVNHADSISHALQMYRVSATKVTLIFYAAILLLLASRYGIAHALRVFTPALCGAIAALSALGIAGVPVNVFSVFALMVLLGVSIDYAIFFAEDQKEGAATSYAVLLSAITTILSFGALAFSSTPALKSFGIVLSVGVLFAALLAPLAQQKEEG